MLRAAPRPRTRLQWLTMPVGSDIAKSVVDFARQSRHAIFVTHSQVGLLERLRRKNLSEDIVRLAQDLQVTVVADRSRGSAVA
jgi:hypothetical protein